MLCQVLRDEQGGEMLEYSLLMGLIVLAAFMVMGGVGSHVLAKWTSLNDLL